MKTIKGGKKMTMQKEFKEAIDLSCKPCREAYWAEMSAEQKIEKLMKELIRTQHAFNRLSEYVTKLIDHDHKDGKLIAFIESPNCESYNGLSFRVYDKKEK